MHCVVYTDGGCLNLKGKAYAGYGFHGYFFTPEFSNKGTGNPRAIPTKDGWKRKTDAEKEDHVTMIRYIEGTGSFDRLRTNNQAELLAVIEVVEYLLSVREMDMVGTLLKEETDKKKTKKKDEEPIDTTIESLLIKSDSEYFLRGYHEWYPNWVKNNWITSTGKPVENKKYWIELVECIDKLKGLGIEFKTEWVRGHDGDVGNEQADLLASLGINRALYGEYGHEYKILPIQGHWKIGTEVPPYFSTQTWYYTTESPDAHTVTWNDETYTLYHVGKSEGRTGTKKEKDKNKKDEDHGKRNNNDTFCVTALKEPNEVLETIRQTQCSIVDPAMKLISFGRLSSIFQSSIYDRLVEYGKYALRARPDNGFIYEVGKAEISQPRPEVLISYRSLETLSEMERMLERCVTKRLLKRECLTDITEVLYDHDEKTGYSLKKSITSANLKVEVDVMQRVTDKEGTKTVPLFLGIDLPTRNALVKMAEDNPKVFALTWMESLVAFRVATVLQTDKGYVLWSGHYSNIKHI